MVPIEINKERKDVMQLFRGSWNQALERVSTASEKSHEYRLLSVPFIECSPLKCNSETTPA